MAKEELWGSPPPITVRVLSVVPEGGRSYRIFGTDSRGNVYEWYTATIRGEKRVHATLIARGSELEPVDE